MTTFGDWVRSTREAKHLTLKECADRANISLQRWGQIETEETEEAPIQRQRATVLKIARGLGVSDQEALRAAGYDIGDNPIDGLDMTSSDLLLEAARIIASYEDPEDRHEVLQVYLVQARAYDRARRRRAKEAQDAPEENYPTTPTEPEGSAC